MPGPLTIILQKKDTITDAVTCGLPTVGIRIPDHITAKQLIRTSGTALAAPSANLSGKPSPTSASMVARDMQDRIPYILDGGNCIVGIESTVIKVVSEQEILILRPGYITAQDLQDVVGPEINITHTQKHLEQSPGTRYTHYTPMGKVYTVKTLKQQNIDDLLAQGHNIGLIATKEFLSEHKQIINSYTQQTDQENTLQPITTFPR